MAKRESQEQVECAANKKSTAISVKSKDIAKKEARASQISGGKSEKGKGTSKSKHLVDLVTHFRAYKDAMNKTLNDLYQQTKALL